MPNEVMQRLREKYPQYNAIDDTTLAQKMVSVYPQYAEPFKEYLPDFSGVNSGAITQQYPEALDQALGRGRMVMNSFAPPGEAINQAVNQFSNGNIVAGAANSVNALARIPGATLNAVNQLYP